MFQYLFVSIALQFVLQKYKITLLHQISSISITPNDKTSVNIKFVKQILSAKGDIQASPWQLKFLSYYIVFYSDFQLLWNVWTLHFHLNPISSSLYLSINEIKSFFNNLHNSSPLANHTIGQIEDSGSSFVNVPGSNNS